MLLCHGGQKWGFAIKLYLYSPNMDVDTIVFHGILNVCLIHWNWLLIESTDIVFGGFGPHLVVKYDNILFYRSSKSSLTKIVLHVSLCQPYKTETISSWIYLCPYVFVFTLKRVRTHQSWIYEVFTPFWMPEPIQKDINLFNCYNFCCIRLHPTSEWTTCGTLESKESTVRVLCISRRVEWITRVKQCGLLRFWCATGIDNRYNSRFFKCGYILLSEDDNEEHVKPKLIYKLCPI